MCGSFGLLFVSRPQPHIVPQYKQEQSPCPITKLFLDLSSIWKLNKSFELNFFHHKMVFPSLNIFEREWGEYSKQTAKPWEPILVLADEITRHVNIIIISLSPSELPLQLHKYMAYLEVIFSESTGRKKKLGRLFRQLLA